MAKSNEPSDAKILGRLRRAKGGLTAAQLGTTASRLRAMDGVDEVGRVKTGKAGRPAILFATTVQNEQHPGGEPDPAAQGRDGSLSEQEVS